MSIHKEVGSQKKLYSIDFNSLNKCSIVVEHDSPDFVRIHIKGSPNKVLPYCKTQLVNNESVGIDMASLNPKRFGKDGARMVAFAYKEMTLSNFYQLRDDNLNLQENPEVLLREATFVGMVGLMDPLVPGVRATLDKVKEAGINMLFVTGEDLETAKQRMHRLGYQLHR